MPELEGCSNVSSKVGFSLKPELNSSILPGNSPECSPGAFSVLYQITKAVRLFSAWLGERIDSKYIVALEAFPIPSPIMH